MKKETSAILDEINRRMQAENRERDAWIAQKAKERLAARRMGPEAVKATEE